MRVVLVTHFYPDHRSGIELIAGHLARRLVGRGFSLTWAASGVTPGAGAEGCNRLPMRAWNGTEELLGVPYPVWGLGSLRRLADAVRRADAVHLHDALYLGNAAAFHAARRFGKPVLVTQHVGLVPYRNPALRGLMAAANRTLARWVLGRADRVVFYARHVADYFGKLVRFRTEPAFVPNGVEAEVFHPAGDRAAVRAELGWPADRPVLLFVGRFVEKKGLAVLREVARRMPDALFAFAGWGPLDPAGWGLPNVRPLGSRPPDRLAPLYRAADLLVLPSVGEGFPLVVQEAMACGTPALISGETAAGNPEAAEWAYPSAPTADAVAETLRRVLADPRGLASRRDRVADFARRAWSWDAAADRYAELLRGLSPAAAPRGPDP